MENLTQRELIIKARDGDVEAFEMLISEHQKRVYNIAFQFFRNHDDALEISQEALIKAFRNIKSFNIQSSIETWLYRITVNACIDEQRKRKKQNVVYLDDEKDEEENIVKRKSAQSTFAEPERALEQNEMRKQILSALESLTLESRSVIILKDIKGFNYDEISEILKIPLGTVKSRINRARQMLRELLSKQKELF